LELHGDDDDDDDDDDELMCFDILCRIATRRVAMKVVLGLCFGFKHGSHLIFTRVLHSIALDSDACHFTCYLIRSIHQSICTYVDLNQYYYHHRLMVAAVPNASPL